MIYARLFSCSSSSQLCVLLSYHKLELFCVDLVARVFGVLHSTSEASRGTPRPRLPLSIEPSESLCSTMASGLPGEDAKTTPLTTLQIVGQICWGCQTSPTKTSGPLKKCSQCRRAVCVLWLCSPIQAHLASRYCSPKCQKADWSRGHKPLCKRFQELNAFDGQISLRRNAKTHDAHMERQGARHQLFCRPTPENEYGDGQSYVLYVTTLCLWP
jgi:hypothetical protein